MTEIVDTAKIESPLMTTKIIQEVDDEKKEIDGETLRKNMIGNTMVIPETQEEETMMMMIDSEEEIITMNEDRTIGTTMTGRTIGGNHVTIPLLMTKNLKKNQRAFSGGESKELSCDILLVLNLCISMRSKQFS